jgi:hypothetical protein
LKLNLGRIERVDTLLRNSLAHNAVSKMPLSAPSPPKLPADRPFARGVSARLTSAFQGYFPDSCRRHELCVPISSA